MYIVNNWKLDKVIKYKKNNENDNENMKKMTIISSETVLKLMPIAFDYVKLKAANLIIKSFVHGFY